MDICACMYKFDNSSKDSLWCFDDENINSCVNEVDGDNSPHSDDGESTNKTSQQFSTLL